MRVFEIKGDVNKFQSLLPRDAKVLQALADGPLWFDGRPRKSEWVPPEMMIMSPKLKAPDIWDVNQGAGFAATDRALPLILEFFEMAGEILPLPIKGQTLHLLNVTVCEDCLDGDKCRWILGDDGERFAVKDDHRPGAYVFDPEMFPESSIFKIPYGSAGMTFCWEEEDDPMCSFKAAVEHHQLRGLKFRELWSRG